MSEHDPRADAAVLGLQGELANQLKMTEESWEEAGCLTAAMECTSLSRDPAFRLHVLYTM